MTIKEVADFLKVNERTIYRLATKGEIPAFKVGTSWRIETKELNIWIENQKTNGKKL
ncbi:TPA: helix-turn-helix domain-containing protein [Legionella pneumophila]|nr:helix-turn-helix domain-containing protein [Legionella pneumophila]HBP6854101.1 helix-turn-helix domain-containing protein [Legionella pneumophila]HBP6881312.1 helix-turn-helix domain-containing protein [Legionella pneumophila]HBP6885364.1 helix-turn-helix domain-containing protein [Legionella pneumophila]HBP6888049.1 helix-turn-helix domain-containing protein [Legionella pneumophila]